MGASGASFDWLLPHDDCPRRLWGRAEGVSQLCDSSDHRSLVSAAAPPPSPLDSLASLSSEAAVLPSFLSMVHVCFQHWRDPYEQSTAFHLRVPVRIKRSDTAAAMLPPCVRLCSPANPFNLLSPASIHRPTCTQGPRVPDALPHAVLLCPEPGRFGRGARRPPAPRLPRPTCQDCAARGDLLTDHRDGQRLAALHPR